MGAIVGIGPKDAHRAVTVCSPAVGSSPVGGCQPPSRRRKLRATPVWCRLPRRAIIGVFVVDRQLPVGFERTATVARARGANRPQSDAHAEVWVCAFVRACVRACMRAWVRRALKRNDGDDESVAAAGAGRAVGGDGAYSSGPQKSELGQFSSCSRKKLVPASMNSSRLMSPSLFVSIALNAAVARDVSRPRISKNFLYSDSSIRWSSLESTQWKKRGRGPSSTPFIDGSLISFAIDSTNCVSWMALPPPSRLRYLSHT